MKICKTIFFTLFILLSSIVQAETITSGSSNLTDTYYQQRERTSSEWVQYPTSNGGVVIKSGSPDLQRIYSPVGDCIKVKHSCGIDLFYPFGTPEEVEHNKSHHPVCSGGSITVETNCSPCSSSVEGGCSEGTASLIDYSNINEVTWSCLGTSEGDVSCSISRAQTNGVCATGRVNGCSSGVFNDLADDASNYIWECLGTSGGSSQRCGAVKPLCGSADGVSMSEAPTTNLCQSGSTPTVVSGTGPWTWDCGTSDTGSVPVSCSTVAETLAWARNSPGCQSDPGGTVERFADGVEDPESSQCYLAGASGWWQTAVNSGCFYEYICGGVTTSTQDGACNNSALNTCLAGDFVDEADTYDLYRWTCRGISGGSEEKCEMDIPNVNGKCGSASGSVKPTNDQNLCDFGNAQNHQKPWNGEETWQCTGRGTGSVVDCATDSYKYYCEGGGWDNAGLTIVGATNEVRNGCTTQYREQTFYINVAKFKVGNIYQITSGRNFSAEVAVGDTPSTILNKIADKINADLYHTFERFQTLCFGAGNSVRTTATVISSNGIRIKINWQHSVIFSGKVQCEGLSQDVCTSQTGCNWKASSTPNYCSGGIYFITTGTCRGTYQQPGCVAIDQGNSEDVSYCENAYYYGDDGQQLECENDPKCYWGQRTMNCSGGTSLSCTSYSGCFWNVEESEPRYCISNVGQNTCQSVGCTWGPIP